MTRLFKGITASLDFAASVNEDPFWEVAQACALSVELEKGIVIGETMPLLEVAMRRGFINPESHATLKSQLEEIAKMISGLINGLENREC